MLAALGVIVSAIVLFVLHKKEPEIITHEVLDPRAEPMRRLALEKCVSGEWKPCVDGLDEARRLDPAGDTRPEVQQARQAADKALNAQPPPTMPSVVPTTAPPNPAPSSNLAPSPSPIDSAFSETMRKTAPAPKAAKPQSTESTESFSPTPPAPVPTPAPSTNLPPSKDDGPAQKTGKPQGKKPAPSKAGSGGSFGSSDFTPDPVGGSAGGSSKK